MHQYYCNTFLSCLQIVFTNLFYCFISDHNVSYDNASYVLQLMLNICQIKIELLHYGIESIKK